MNALKVAAIIAMLAAPAAGFERATSDECTQMWRNVVSELPRDWNNVEAAGLAVATASDDGFCVLTAGAVGLEKGRFETVSWRVDGINRMLSDRLPPTTLELIITAIEAADDTSLLPTDLRVLLAYDQDSRSLLVQDFAINRPDGNRFQATTVLNHIDMSSRAAIAISLGGVSMSQLAGRMQIVGGDDIFAFRSEPVAGKTDLIGAIRALPADIIPAESVDAVAHAVQNTDENGDLAFTLRSERGIGLLQLFVSRFVGNTDDGFLEGLEIILDGVEVTFDWQPVP